MATISTVADKAVEILNDQLDRIKDNMANQTNTVDQLKTASELARIISVLVSAGESNGQIAKEETEAKKLIAAKGTLEDVFSAE